LRGREGGGRGENLKKETSFEEGGGGGTLDYMFFLGSEEDSMMKTWTFGWHRVRPHLEREREEPPRAAVSARVLSN